MWKPSALTQLFWYQSLQFGFTCASLAVWFLKMSICQVLIMQPGFGEFVAGCVHNRGLPICSCQGGPQCTSLPGVCCGPLPPGCGLHQEAPDPPHDQAAAAEQGVAGKQAAAAEMCSSSCSPAQAGCSQLHLGLLACCCHAYSLVVQCSLIADASAGALAWMHIACGCPFCRACWILA